MKSKGLIDKCIYQNKVGLTHKKNSTYKRITPVNKDKASTHQNQKSVLRISSETNII